MAIILIYLITSLSALLVITVMGFSKAYTSYKLGDVDIKNRGKVSLNPKKHFEIIGFILIVLLGYGWTAPLDTSSLYYKNRKKGNILVCLVPLLIAIILAFVLSFFQQLLLKLKIDNIGLLLRFLNITAVLLVQFALFNILPVYPLFGQKLFQTILPANKGLFLSQYEKIIQVITIMLLFMGFLPSILNTLAILILGFINNIINLILGFL